jgi:membrane-bound inhibitor of C-type lysozyme
VALVVLLAGCAGLPTQPPREPEPRPPKEGYVRYRCAQNMEFGATFQQQGKRVLLETGGWSHLLPGVPSAGGMKYSDGRITLWTKGAEARVEQDGKPTLRDCRMSSRK